jgi:hypothetical protein
MNEFDSDIELKMKLLQNIAKNENKDNSLVEQLLSNLMNKIKYLKYDKYKEMLKKIHYMGEIYNIIHKNKICNGNTNDILEKIKINLKLYKTEISNIIENYIENIEIHNKKIEFEINSRINTEKNLKKYKELLEIDIMKEN